MKRLLRCAFNMAVIALAVLGLALVVLTARGHFAAVQIEWAGQTRLYKLYSSRGLLLLARHHSAEDDRTGYGYVGLRAYEHTPPFRLFSYIQWGNLVEREWPALGLAYHVYASDPPPATGGFGQKELVVPGWPVAIACLAPAGVAVLLRRRRRREYRRRQGLCVSCGYDLRATVDRCPECGAVPSAKGAKP